MRVGREIFKNFNMIYITFKKKKKKDLHFLNNEERDSLGFSAQAQARY
jgi:hypothetical protein